MQLNLIATSVMGLEALAARELKELGLDPRNSESLAGRTRFVGTERDLVRANLHLRTAGKVLIELAEFDLGDDFEVLFDAVDSVAWEDWMPSDAAVTVEARSVRSTITSVPALQRAVKKGIAGRLCRAYRLDRLGETGPAYSVELSVYKDRACLTLNSTGRGLHRRGYRLLNAAAPLRETLAAALVDLSVWNGDRPLLDPFCGSGTILIEAAMKARRIAPGLSREFDAEAWPVFPASIWEDARREARARILPSIPERLRGVDIDPEALKYARYHARRAGVENDVDFELGDFLQVADPRPYGCVITNPPYGERLGEKESLRPLYESIPAVLSRFPTWSHYVYTAWNDFETVIGQEATRRRKIYNGRIECTYFQFLGPKPPRGRAAAEPAENGTAEPIAEVSAAGNPPTETDAAETPIRAPAEPKAVFAGLDDYAGYQEEQFRRCLANRARHLRNYPKRGITCYRLYERDFPEVPLVIDIYEGEYLHIAEFDRPDGRTPGVHRLWLDRMTAAAAETLGIAPENVFLKRRARQKGTSQYEKLGEQGRFITAREGGLSFRCNMTDYLDTGLFLDHRLMRGMVRDQAAGKRFLNLFCYTGSFTCYAADGGAASSVSVDLSPRYLEWAEANLEMNGLAGEHRFIRADVMKFLANPDLYGVTEPFDLCVCDPPTFSNSKSTESDWDVRRRHAELLRLLAGLIVPGGAVYFSSNFRHFKLDEESLADLYQIREISRRTVPEEFRNKHIHKSWRMIRCASRNAGN
ncbi:MAG: bifunctional 23S rRNA (guanine(2069)-N(7))-methyltransferase RlmK/23S rRNA (guanine(2445)-N(2))-methyltransferase RlmL [Thermoguttaceae bacterium]|nr:bifunctional 23S rRNA (guanine(2069)-N(7))-methyltransferase RlmK/23S rRNA (guanine(2445)-N(2))-methyltransferase RlmL [Thermoguttaceae bacterium]